MATEDEFDRTAIAGLREMVGPEVLEEIVDLFNKNSPLRLEEVRAGAKSEDPKAIAMAMHSLKSSAGMLGATRLQRLSEKIEHLARNGEIDEIRLHLDHLAATHARALEYLRESSTA